MPEISTEHNTEYSAIIELDDRLESARGMISEDIHQGIAEYEKLLKTKPDWIDALIELAMLYQETENTDKARKLLQNAAETQKVSGRLWAHLGRSHLRTGGGEIPALTAYDQADKLEYQTPRFLAEKAECFIGLENYSQAEKYLNEALEISPNSMAALHTKGALMEVRGDMDNARECYEKILQMKPGSPETLYRLSDMGMLSNINFAYCDPGHEIYNKRKLRWQEKASLGFARGIYLAKQKEYDRAFKEYKYANDLFAEHYPFDIKALKERTDRHISFFTEELLKDTQRAGSTSHRPVFIVGMPRSGTTLIEQILSSHSKIAAGGELYHILRIEAQQTMLAEQKKEQYPEILDDLGQEKAKDYAEQYFSYLNEFISDKADFIIDKLPHNFLNIGLIKLIFPNATIIHARRNPADTCLSCYLKKFNSIEHLSYTFDLESLGHFYNEYRRLMDHWYSVLPGQILDIEYEELLDNQKDVTQRMLDHIGVDWEDSCLDFHNNERVVKTASLYQVRQPIYKTSTGRWKRYENHLAPLLEILKQ